MLEALRKNASGLLAKILIGLLIVSFAVWGIGDMVRSYGRDSVASVGGNTIKTTEFRQAYQLQLDAIARQFRRRLTPQEAKAFGVEQQVLARLTGTAAVDNHTRELHLDITDKAIEKDVYADPMFAGLDGKFSSDRLGDVLRQTGYSEQQFFQARKRDTLRAQITDALLSNVTPPKTLIDMLNLYQGEQRTVNYIEVTPAKAVKLGTPTEADLKKTYETNKKRFVVPEYRKFQALLLTSDAAKAKLKISDADLKTAYEADKASFAIPEKRRIQQIPFKDEAAAKAAKAELDSGKKKFEDVAKEAGAKPADIELGTLTKRELIDPAIAEAAFKLEKDKVSDPVKGRFKTVLLRVTEIKAGEQQPFEAVKADIRRQIENRRVADKLQELQNNVDDNRLAGKTLKEISEILKLPFLDVAETDRDGNRPDGKPAFESKDKQRLIRTAFAAEVGVENEVIQLSGDGYGWLSLIAVTPEKQKPQKDVTEDIKKVWAEIETRKKLAEATTAYAKRINEGAKLEDIAKEIGAKVKTTPAFKRGDSVPDLPAPAISRAFALQSGKAADATGSNPETRLVLQLIKIEPPKEPSEAAGKALAEQLKQQLRTDIVAQYVSDLQKRMGVSINSTIVGQITGSNIDTSYPTSN